jgi:hypothetical protein
MTSHLEDSNVAISDSDIVLHHQQRIHHGKPSKFEQATTDAETQSAGIMPENWLSIGVLANQAPPVSGQPLPRASTVGGATAFDFGDIIFIYGTEGDDVISWQGGLIVIQGLGGNDQIYGPSHGGRLHLLVSQQDRLAREIDSTPMS